MRIFTLLHWTASFFVLAGDNQLNNIAAYLGSISLATAIVNTIMTLIFQKGESLTAFAYPFWQLFLVSVEFKIG